MCKQYCLIADDSVCTVCFADNTPPSLWMCIIILTQTCACVYACALACTCIIYKVSFFFFQGKDLTESAFDNSTRLRPTVKPLTNNTQFQLGVHQAPSRRPNWGSYIRVLWDFFPQKTSKI